MRGLGKRLMIRPGLLRLQRFLVVFPGRKEWGDNGLLP